MLCGCAESPLCVDVCMSVCICVSQPDSWSWIMMVINSCTDPWPLCKTGADRQDMYTHTHTHMHIQAFSLCLLKQENRSYTTVCWLVEQRRRLAADAGSLLLYFPLPPGDTVKQHTGTTTTETLPTIKWGGMSGLGCGIVCGTLLVSIVCT